MNLEMFRQWQVKSKISFRFSKFIYNVPETLDGKLVFVEAANSVTHQLKPQFHIISTELASPMAENGKCHELEKTVLIEDFCYDALFSNEKSYNFETNSVMLEPPQMLLFDL